MLAICGIHQVGLYFLIYIIVEANIVSLILRENQLKENEHSPTFKKSVYELVLCRFCSTIMWCIIFSITNSLFTPKEYNGWEILNYWFPPDVHYLYDPPWNLIMVLVIFLGLTLITFKLYVLKNKSFLYYITICITSLIMFCILTRAGIPLYWH